MPKTSRATISVNWGCPEEGVATLTQALPVRKRFLFALNRNLLQFFFVFRFVFQLYLVQVFNIFLIRRTNCCCTTFQHLAGACLEVHLASAAGNLPQFQFRLQFQFINANLLQLALGNCSRKWRPARPKKSEEYNKFWRVESF